ncbi:nucleoside kinase [Pseudoflavonifractor sp. 60]|uniref:uridine kinase family protein n=1 Tax=Pseudoflavonifractor sp. 60 TaxID=2304576 RepID=UPI0013682D95|nr:nucleoside kinase [Pseudoflavonifractor sp. 60]NBI65671.1 nucleoside kinase [Pseudoflavonifractor sp. 60]
MAYQLQEINRRIQKDVTEFLAECDDNYAQRVSLAADKILSNLERSPIVLLSGPSGSGKTTTAMKIAEELRRRGVNSHAVAMDNYFVTLDPKTAPRTPEGTVDYESPLFLDMELLDQHFTALSQGEEILIPKYEFARQMRNDSLGTPLKLEKNEIAIFEGIHALNDDMAGRHPEATKLYISARSNINEGAVLRFKGTWMRLTRRAVRDYSFRGTDVARTLDMWANVRRGEKLYISPFKGKADIVFDSSLPYEVSVMRSYALPILQSVPEDNERRGELLELVAAFDHFAPIDPALVAKNSLLREFIGGGSYKYH